MGKPPRLTSDLESGSYLFLPCVNSPESVCFLTKPSSTKVRDLNRAVDTSVVKPLEPVLVASQHAKLAPDLTPVSWGQMEGKLSLWSLLEEATGQHLLQNKQDQLLPSDSQLELFSRLFSVINFINFINSICRNRRFPAMLANADTGPAASWCSTRNVRSAFTGARYFWVN